MSDFEIHAALTTPFRADGWVDLDALRAHVRVLVDDGVDGIVPAGTTGEGPLLEESEVGAVVATAVEAAEARIEVIAHVGRVSTSATARLAKAAATSGADALIAVTPYYYAHDDEALLAHYRSILAAADGVQVLAYTFPERTGNELAPEVLDALAGDGLAGLKDSTKSPERHAEYLEVARRHDGFRVFVGSERLTLTSIEGGGAGTISALANARADVLLRVREERSVEAQEAVDRARAELPAIPDTKRAVGERLAELGVSYPVSPRAPLGG
jgi:2-dehydro-3-deoxy-phosphogluconate/2-dehydro-3-deoxy-6-phosphogalactonate aldolase